MNKLGVSATWRRWVCWRCHGGGIAVSKYMCVDGRRNGPSSYFHVGACPDCQGFGKVDTATHKAQKEEAKRAVQGTPH